MAKLFLFVRLFGNPTAEMGYEEADSFDEHGNTVQTLGGRKLPG